jgi:hypothetical protein
MIFTLIIKIQNIIPPPLLKKGGGVIILGLLLITGSCDISGQREHVS